MKRLGVLPTLLFPLLAGAPSITAGQPLSLPGIPDFRLPSAGVVDTVFPAATGGAAPYAYSLSGQPPGITFFPGTRAASGTLPTVATETAYTVTYGVADGAGDAASVTFLATVVPPTPPPLSLPDLPDFRLPSAGVVDTVFPAATGGAAPYTYSLSGQPPGITFFPGTRVASGTLPTVATETNYTVTYGVSDGAGDAASVTFLATVVPPSAPPPSPSPSPSPSPPPQPAPPPPTSTYSLPFTESRTNASGEEAFAFTLASAAVVNVSLTGMDRDIDCRVNSTPCTNQGGTQDDSWSGTLEAGIHTVTVYPYGGGSGAYTLSVSAETTSAPAPGTSEPRYFKLSLPWESDVEVHLTDMTIDFDCKVNDSPCTNYGNTRDDSWTGTLAAGDHVIEVYPYRPGSGSYTLSLKVSPTLTSSYYGSVTKTETLVDVSEKDVSSSRSYPFTLEHGAEVSVALTGLTIDFDCKVDDSRCTTAAAPRTIRGAARWPPATTRSRPTPTIRAPGTTRSP